MKIGRLGVRALSPLLLAAFVGCSETTGNSGRNPNSAAADINTLLERVEVGQFSIHEGSVPQIFCMWLQQCQGTGGRFQETRGGYEIVPTDADADWVGVYSGLVDERKIQELATAAGDLQYKGIAEVWEGFTMGSAADIWGDVPYSEALTSPTPVFDPQRDVYAAVETVLSTAISDLAGGGPGPGTFDLVYGGDVAKWTELAHTLKARYYLNTAEVDAGVWERVLEEAAQGLSTPANDFTAVHTSATSSRNLWFQYSLTAFGPDLTGGPVLLALLRSTNDPRYSQYFDGAGTLNGTRNRPEFPQPMATYAETQLMIAEAQVRLGQSGQAAFDAERASQGVPSLPATLQNILTEKYIALFQTIQAFNDWKRTCIPALDPINDVIADQGASTAAGSPQAIIPRRLFYGETELNANPEHTPDETEQLTRGGIGKDNPGDMHGFRNPNDPGDPPGCPSVPAEE